MRLRRIDRYITDPEIWDEAVAAITKAALVAAGLMEDL
jgi:hypothetical protein